MSEQSNEVELVDLPEAVEVGIDEIKPYANNPRRIPQEAVDAVITSLKRYGYVQPIGVQKSTMEIVVGHTRYTAMQQLGVERVKVYLLDIDDEKAKAYRLVDNRTSEMSNWDQTSLVMELREWETELLDQFFEDVDLEIGQINAVDVTQDDVDNASEEIKKVRQPLADPLTNVHCPSCTGVFQVKSASLPGLSYQDLEELKVRANG